MSETTTLAPVPAAASDARPTVGENGVREIGIIMNGVSGRMGYRQHLVRSILAIRDQGGIELPDGTRVTVKPILVGRSEAKLAELAALHGIEDYTSDLDAALADPRWEIYADFLVTKARVVGPPQGDRRRQDDLHREAHRRDGRRGARAREARRRPPASRPASCTTSSTSRVCRSSSA